MRLRAYVKLQECSTKDRRVFVSRTQPSHGIAKGPIKYWSVEGENWTHLRRVLKHFGVMNHTGLSPFTVSGFVEDPTGTCVCGTLSVLTKEQLPAAVLIDPPFYASEYGRPKTLAPKLNSFGPDAVEIHDPRPAA